MIHRLTRAFAALLLVLGVAAGQAPAVHGLAATGPGWEAVQSTGLSYAPQGPGVWDNQTLRMVARVSAGGTSIRIRLADVFSSQPAQIGHVTVGTQMNGGSTLEATPPTVTFGGAQAVTIPAGGVVASDPVSFTVTANTRLLVSIYIAAGAQLSQAPRHDLADETEYNHTGGDVTASQYYPTTNTFGFTTLLDGIDVQSAAPATVVAIGDSITDGLGTASEDAFGPRCRGRRRRRRHQRSTRQRHGGRAGTGTVRPYRLGPRRRHPGGADDDHALSRRDPMYRGR
jgi:hypothetical protein